MTNVIRILPLSLTVAALGSCLPIDPIFVELPVETQFAFMNFSMEFYASLEMRPHRADGPPADYARLALLPPGGILRGNFRDVFETGCPDAIDFRLFLYRRVNEGIPIGLDATEAVETTPIVAGEVLAVPACCVEPVEVYTIVNWEAPEGMARVKFAEGTAVEAVLRRDRFFGNDEAVWEVDGVDPNSSAVPPPAPAPKQPIAGRVVLDDGTGVEGVGVMLRTRVLCWWTGEDPNNYPHCDLNCDPNCDPNFDPNCGDPNDYPCCQDPNDDPDAEWSLPIAVTITDSTGSFAFDRPTGAYRVEVISEDYAFQPIVVDVESPLDDIKIVAEPL